MFKGSVLLCNTLFGVISEEVPGPPNVTLHATSSTSIKVMWSQSSNSKKDCSVLAYSVDLIQTDTQGKLNSSCDWYIPTCILPFVDIQGTKDYLRARVAQ